MRVRSIDLLRGLALMAMALIHFVVYLGDAGAAKSWTFFLLNHVLGDWGAACFLMLMGMSQVLSANRRAGDGSPELGRALLRGSYIFVVGLAMLALAWGPRQLWLWDILTLMGTMTVVVLFFRRLPSSLVLAACLVVAVATPWLRTGIDYASVWGGAPVLVPVVSDYLPGVLLDPAADFRVIWTVPDVVRGFFFTGQFPLLPWSLFPLVGIVVGRRIVEGRLRGDLPFLGVIGALLVGLGLGGAWASRFRPGSSAISDYLAPLSFYPDSFTMIAFQLGMALLVFGGLYRLLDAGREEGDAPGDSHIVVLCARTSRFALTFYFLHYLLIGWPMAVAAALTGRDPHAGFLGASAALAAGLVALVLLELLLLAWERRGGSYSLEWGLAALGGLLGLGRPALPPGQSVARE